MYAGQAVALGLLVGRGEPLAATILGLLGTPQLLILARPSANENSEWYVRHVAPFLATAMLIAAWAL
jgi:hypothetical protein